MKDPENRPDHGGRPDDVGKARKRQSAFEEARGITEENAEEFAASYTAGVAEALAMRARHATTDQAEKPSKAERPGQSERRDRP